MELHSYAKRRTLKKWTVEQKRKLVEARIAHDAWFTNKPSSVVPWKNILIAAKLDDFNVFFVRKQWSNMVTRYKQYKQLRLGSNIASKAIEAELIKRINQEWEFFEPIHMFMTRKTTNLHSYALTHRTDNKNGEQQETEEPVQKSTITEQDHRRQTNETFTKVLHNDTITINLPKDCAKENIPNNATIVVQSNKISQDDGIHVFSSDTNEEFEVFGETTRIINAAKELQLAEDEEDENMICVRNTDHDFYSKRSFGGIVNCNEEDDLQEKQSNYFADASEESQGSTNMAVDSLQANNTTTSTSNLNKKAANDSNLEAADIKAEDITHCEILNMKEENQDEEFYNDMPSTSTEKNTSQNMRKQKNSAKPRLSERDKYYRHKRRFNRRLEKRFDAVLEVMSKIVKSEYPYINITPLLSTVNSLSSNIGKVLSSDSEDDVENNIPTNNQDNN